MILMLWLFIIIILVLIHNKFTSTDTWGVKISEDDSDDTSFINSAMFMSMNE